MAAGAVLTAADAADSASHGAANADFLFDSGIDIRKWLPGAYTEKITVTLPQDIAPGKYTGKIGMHNDNIPVIYLRTDAERNGAYYTVGEMIIK